VPKVEIKRESEINARLLYTESERDIHDRERAKHSQGTRCNIKVT
jgi:hypothetical protein